MFLGAPGCCAASLPDIPWVPPTLLCFLDTKSSEMPPNGPGRLWFYLLTAAVSMCQPYNQGWVQLLALLPSLCFCFPAALVQFSALLLQDMEMLGVHPRSQGGLMKPSPNFGLSYRPPVHGVNELFIPRHAGACLWPPV